MSPCPSRPYLPDSTLLDSKSGGDFRRCFGPFEGSDNENVGGGKAGVAVSLPTKILPRPEALIGAPDVFRPRHPFQVGGRVIGSDAVKVIDVMARRSRTQEGLRHQSMDSVVPLLLAAMSKPNPKIAPLVTPGLQDFASPGVSSGRGPADPAQVGNIIAILVPDDRAPLFHREIPSWQFLPHYTPDRPLRSPQPAKQIAI